MLIRTLCTPAALLVMLTVLGCNRDKGSDDTGTVGVDADGDGYIAGSDVGEDCDDADPAIHPGATEECDGIDNDCDGTFDNGQSTTTWYQDGDGDGYGDTEVAVEACAQPAGYAEASGDCDDADTAFHPGATEDNCTDPNDYNCDGSVGYADADGDRYPACLECDDNSATTYPGAEETCNGVDDDCDGEIDDNATDADTWYIDYDTDGYGSSRYELVSCEQPSGFVSNSDDCDDVNDNAYPGADEVCDGADNNCDGDMDEDAALDAITWYQDLDGDGYGVPEVTTVACEEPSGFAPTADDCDDDASAVYPDADEVCNNIDDNCDGDVDESTAADASTWYADGDDDGYGLDEFTSISCEQPANYAAVGGDCYDDGTAFGATINPEGEEICDSYDNDCDGTVDENEAEDAEIWYADGDEDGYGTDGDTATACDQPSGYVDNTDDCDDDDDGVNPGAVEVCNDGIDNNCDDTADGCSTTIADADVILYGESANSSTGTDISYAGDVNGDGRADLIVGAPFADTSAADAGAVYLAYGSLASGEYSIGDVDVTFVGGGSSAGSGDDRAGSSVSGGGDLDGDGYDDVLIGGIRFSQTRKVNRGVVYAMFGPLSGEVDLSSTYDIRMVGEDAYDRIGAGVASSGDLDDDGFADIALGGGGYDGAAGDNTGVVYVRFGTFSAVTTDFTVSSADITLSGDGANDGLGGDIAMPGDLDGDGVGDLVVGNAAHDDSTLGSDVGCVYLLTDLTAGSYSISDVAETVIGQAAVDQAGNSVAAAGDLDDDGYDDLIVGAVGRDGAGENSGAAYVLYGPVTYSSLASAPIKLLGARTGDSFATSVEGNGDSDGDGNLDLVVGAPSADGGGGENAGGAFVFHGPLADGSYTSDDAAAAVYGDELDTNLGGRVTFVGDTSGSGSDDLLMAASGDDRGGSDAGAVFLFTTLGL